MCGIVAVLSKNGPICPALLGRMRDQLAHRGPDGADQKIIRFNGSEVGLAHRRLSIIDLSANGAQPMSNGSGDVWVTFNGEIYNYLELRSELIGLGHKFRSSSDTEVLLQAYERWGAECLTRLNGMFAFVILDQRTRKLLVARDRFGEKPLYYSRLPQGGFAFASEAKALLPHPDVGSSINENVLSRHMLGSAFEFGEETLFASVFRLDAAHAMIIGAEDSSLQIWRYWTPNYEDVRHDETIESASEKFQELFSQSIRARRRSDVAVGSNISGGIDSSTILGELVRQGVSGMGQHAFTVRFDDDLTVSEGRFVDKLARSTPISFHSVSPTASSLMEDWYNLHWANEIPLRSASVYNQYAVMRLAKQHGVTVLLDGQGADELLGGYQYYFGMYQLDLLSSGSFDLLERDSALFWWRLKLASSKYAQVSRRFAEKPGYPLEVLWNRRANKTDVGKLEHFDGVPSDKQNLFRRQLALSLHYHHLPNLLHTADRNGMAFGREARFPFLDHRLVDWCAGLPTQLLCKNGWLKYLLRVASKDIVPKAIRWRVDKVGFTAPQDTWLRGEGREWAMNLLFDGPLAKRPEYSSKLTHALWDQHQAGATDASGELWRWMSINQWLSMAEADAWSSSNLSQA
jgi:asparagine synthase (glutamine-hydrolysing)